MINTKKIEAQIESTKISKARLCSQLHIARSTLDAILNGGDAKISTIEAIANALNVKIGFLFDEEEKIQIREAGRDYVEKGKIEHHGTENNISESYSTSISDLEKENAELKNQLIEAQATIIDLLKKQH